MDRGVDVNSRAVAIVTGCCGVLLMAAGAVVAFRTAPWSEGRTWGAVVFVLGMLMTLAFVFADRYDPHGRDKR